MLKIEITIDKITDYSSYPGWVECSLFDVWNNKHTYNEKIPIVTALDIAPEDKFPQKGFIRCELIKERNDHTGKKILTVNTTNPDGIETLEGITELDVFENQVSKLE